MSLGVIQFHFRIGHYQICDHVMYQSRKDNINWHIALPVHTRYDFGNTR